MIDIDKFVFTADLHLSEYGNDKIDSSENLSEKLTGIKKTIYNIAEYCVKNKIPTIVIGGDLLHDKSKIYTVALNILLEFFRSYKNKLNFIVIDGNHDLSGKAANVVSALGALQSEENVLWITQNSKQIEDVLFVPNSVNMVNIIKKSSAKYLISHLGINEAVLSSGISVPAEIKFKDLEKKYEVVLLGHYHKPQHFGNENLQVFYVGSPVQLDWGEKHEEKRFLVIDRKNNTIQSVETSGYKKYFELELTEENKKEVVLEARKLQANGHRVNLKKLNDITDDDSLKEFHVIDRTEKDITNRGITTAMSMAEILNKFMEIKKVPDEKTSLYAEVALRIMEGNK